MSEKAEIDACTAWVNVHLAQADCQVEDVVLDLLKGLRLRALLQSITGSAPKRLNTLDGLTVDQKVMRVDWFADSLKKSKKLPNAFKVDSRMIALQSAEHLLPLLHHLMNHDVTFIYERAPCFMKKNNLRAMLCEPLQQGPHRIVRDSSEGKPSRIYTTSKGKLFIEHLMRSLYILLQSLQAFLLKRLPEKSTHCCMFSVTNALIKTTRDGQRLVVKDYHNLADSRIDK